jgi:hypothetical protein
VIAIASTTWATWSSRLGGEAYCEVVDARDVVVATSFAARTRASLVLA